MDSSGNAVVVGVTNSPDFPVTGDALEKSHPDATVVTGFLVKLTPNGSMLFATYLGGSGNNTAESIAMDSQGDIYVTGSSQGFDSIQFGSPPASSSNLPVALELVRFPISRSFTFPMPSAGAAYVLKLRPDAWTRLYLKYLGGTEGEGKDVTVDNAGRVWVTGGAGEINPSDSPFPLLHPFQAIGDSFVTQLSSDGSTILFSSRAYGLGGLALDRSGDLFVAGEVNVVTPAPCGPLAGTSCISIHNVVQLTGIDAGVPSTITIDEPQRFVPITHSNLQGEGVAAGELVIITGTGLGPKQTVSAQLTTDGNLSTSLAGTQVTFNGTPAPLLSVAEGRIVCITPLATGVNQLLTSADVILGTIMMRVESVNGSVTMRIGTLPSAVAALAVVNADGSVNSPAHPAASGSVFTIYAEGFGIEPFAVDGQVSKAANPLFFSSAATAAIGGTRADIVYIGSAPGQVAGVVQINVRVPAQLAAGSYSATVGLSGSALAPQGDSATFLLNIGGG